MNKIEQDLYKKAKVMKALSICVLYGYLDYALEIFDATHRLFSKSEGEKVREKMQKIDQLSGRIPNFRGRGRIANVFYVLWKILQPRHWAEYAKVLGNLE